jgi:putative ABC transport system permease protein
MLKNYLKIAFRSMTGNKIFTFINIIGLAVGIACFITITIFILDEISYDKFHENADRIFRVYVDSNVGGKVSTNSKTAGAVGEILKKDFPEVANYTRIGYQGNHVLRYNDNISRESRIYTADSTYFEIFSFPLIYGNVKTALVRPNSIVLTETMAKKYFGNENPLGKTFLVDDTTTYMVTGLMKDFPKKSSFSCSALLSMSTFPPEKNQFILNLWYTTYVLLKEGTEPKLLEEKMKKTVIDYVGPQVQAILGVSIKELRKKGDYYAYKLQPFTSIYLHSVRDYGIDPNTEWSDEKTSDIDYVYIFSAIAIFILLIAVINFMNLATARSERKAKEVGIRKTLGSSRYKLIAQFITEAVFMCCLSVLLALILLQFVLPAFGHFIERDLSLGLLSNFYTIPLLIIFTIIVGTLAGSYPAFYLSSFMPAHVMKSYSGKGSRKKSLRSVMVIIQFTISITLIIGTIIIKEQLDFIQNKNLGFNKEHLLYIYNAKALKNDIEVFKNELMKNKNVVAFTNNSHMFCGGIPGSGYFYDKKAGDDVVSGQYVDVDYDFLKTYDIKLKQGRFFSREFPTDSNAVLVNEAAIKEFGATNPIGKSLISVPDGKRRVNFYIIGVVKDFNYESLHNKVRPLVLNLRSMRQPANVITVRIASNDMRSTIKYIENTWSSFTGNERFIYRFVEENIARLYSKEEEVGTLATIFSMLAIFIACLGLFGLAAFVTEQRIKEIGIRKVLGASATEIVMLLSIEFTKWVVIANLVAWPIAFYFIKNWLQNFAYKIDMPLGVFVLSGLIAMVIAIGTVSAQTIKAALSNPVKSLKYE